jgi:putative sterol carrier protein
MSDAPTMEPAAFARLVREATDDQLAAGLRASGKLIVEGVVRGMPDAFAAESASGIEAILQWRVALKPDEPPTCWRLRIADGRCTMDDDPDAPADVTYDIGAVDFLRLVAGQLDGPQLFLTGRLRIEGDLVLAARMPSLFRPPA